MWIGRYFEGLVGVLGCGDVWCVVLCVSRSFEEYFWCRGGVCRGGN